MSIRSSLVLAMSLGLALAGVQTAGALTLKEVQAVAKCQDTIDKEGRALVKKEMEAVEGCALAKLNLALKDDNGLITPEKLAAENVKATTKCNGLFQQVATASTRFIDQMIKNCTPVTGIVLDPISDPLGLMAFWVDPPSIEDLAGAMCGESIVLADFLSGSKAPRGVDIVFTDPDVVLDNLDARCLACAVCPP